MMHISMEGFSMVMEVLGLVAGVLGAFLIFFGFLPEKNKDRFTGKAAKIYEFLNFRIFIVEDVLKFIYILAACLCTGLGVFLALSVVGLTRGLVFLVGGNLIARVIFELLMLFVRACRNLGKVEKMEKELEGLKQEKKSPSEPEIVTLAAVRPESKPEIKLEFPAAEAAVSKSKQRICPNCGETCKGAFAFCNMCGTKLN